MHRVMSQFLKPDAPVIFMQHGLLASSDGWTANGPKESPAFKFANAGYDVWLGNNRGNYHSRRHETLDPKKDESEFFTYSFVELGKYDLPAQIDEVRKLTGVEKVTYMGHSQGTTQMFYALGTNEAWLDERVNLFIALAPIIRLGHTTNAGLKKVSKYRWSIGRSLKSMHIYEVAGKEYRDKKYKFCKGYRRGKLCDYLNK